MRRLKFSIYYFQELNYRLIYSWVGTILFFFTTYTYKQSLIFIFLPQGLSHFVSTGLTEIFFAYLQLCIVTSIGFSMGIVLVQLFIFFCPGLYTYEAKAYRNLLLLAICFYICLYTTIFPLLIQILWKLFYAYSINFTPIHLTFEPKLNDYLQHLKQLNIVLSFSFPCFLGLSLVQRYTGKKMWVKYRGFLYIVAFTIAAFLTPPDIVSQALIGIPLIIFFEVQTVYWGLHKEYKKRLLIRQPIESHKNTDGKKKKS